MSKQKTLGDLLNALKKLSPEELKKPAFYNSKDLYISGQVLGFGKARATLYWDGSDDPSEIKTRQEWKDDGYDNEEISEMEVAIQKGDFVITF